MPVQSLPKGTDASPETRGAVLNGGSSTPPFVPIAIIGMSCRFGGDATSPSKLWDLCVSGKDCWTPIPTERFDAKSLYDEQKEKPGRHNVLGGYFLKDISSFDAAFYNFPTDVSNAMDPQVRLLLESVYESVEDAGIPIGKLAGSNTSVFSGGFSYDYSHMQMGDSEVMPISYITGNGIAMLSNRISHFYDFQGASMSIDVGCSTGMVALHQACRTLQSGESDISIVGAVSALISPNMFIGLSTAGVLGPNGKCFAWDDRAEGYGRGEGVATLVLKPLDAAIRDGDFVHAVVRESGLNQDGKTATITSPSMEAQMKLIEECYARAGLNPADTSYIEAHMTGTLGGDHIEAEAIARTFGKSRNANDPVLVGGVKTNVGHTEAVSGLAAIIKTAFALRNGLIPPNLNYEKTNPKIPLEKWNLQVPTTLTPWPADKPLRASINNFGYGGTNAHVILEAAPKISQTNGSHHNGTVSTNGNGSANGASISLPEEADSSLVYVVSAKDSVAAQGMNKNIAAYIRESVANGTAPLPTDLAYTLAERRSLFTWVTAVRARSLAELADRLDEPDRKALRSTTRKPRLGFVFNGQGAQWYAMGRELINAYPVFGSAILNADRILKDYGAKWSLYEELMRDENSTRVHEIRLSQPISVALQLCLVDLLKSWDIIPSAVTSHSSGEIAAAYAVGVLSFKEALGVVYFRGELAQKHHERMSLAGGMLAAGLSAEKAEEYLKDISGGVVVVACHNSPDSVTLSGDLAALDEVASRLDSDGIFARKLNVPLAYHSHHMGHMAQDYTDSLKAILPATSGWTGTLFSSPVTGDIVTSPKVLSAEHYVRNLTSPVLFSQAFENMCFSAKTSDGSSRSAGQDVNVDLIVEIGAHGTLSSPIRQILKERKIPYVSCLKRSVNAVDTMQDTACELLARGYPVSLAKINFHDNGKFVPALPSYAWNHTSTYWTESRTNREHRHKRFPPHQLLGTPVSGGNRLTPTWRNFLRTSDISWLKDHKIESDMVFPGAGYVAMAIEAVRLLTDPSEEKIHGYRMRDIDITNTLTIPDTSAGVEIQLCLRPCNEKELDYKGWYEFEVCSVSGTDDSWIQHCKGYVTAETISTSKAAATKSEMKVPSSESFFAPGSKVATIEAESTWGLFRKMRLYHGPAFQNLISSQVATGRNISTLALSPAASDCDRAYVLHPTTLDSLIHALYVSVPPITGENAMVVPRSFRSIFIHRDLKRQTGDKLRVFVNLLKADKRGARMSGIAVNDNENEGHLPLLQIEEFYCQAMALDEGDAADAKAPNMCAENRWELDILHDFPASVKDSMKINLNDEQLDFEKTLDRASYIFINEAVTELEGATNVESWQWHHKRLYDWMKSVVERGKLGELGPGSQNWSKTNKGLKLRLIDDLEAGNASGRLTSRVGQKLASIVRGEVTPLELMMKDGLLNQYYEDIPRLRERGYHHLKRIVELYASKQPGASVLEIGGGTGGATTIVLEGFAARAEGGSGSLLGHYDFTDVSSGFFDAARKKLASWGNLVDFKKLDISSDPTEQSFVAGSYDLIIASSVLHATPNLKKTITNVRKLLKPGGKLLMVEATTDRLDTQLIFGTTPGWWLSEEPERKMSPNASLKTWDEVFKATGFAGGVEFCIADCEESQFLAGHNILTTATDLQPAYPSSISIVYTEASPAVLAWSKDLTEAIEANTGASVAIETLGDLQVKQDVVYIFTPEMTKPFLDGMDSTAFEQLKNLLVNGGGILWLSCSSVIDAKDPLYAQCQGLLRTMKQEDSYKRYVQLDFESNPESPWSKDKIPHTVHVLQQCFNANIESRSIEWEYAVKDSMLHVPRIYPSPAQDRASSETPVDPAPELQPFWQAERTLVWETTKSGVLSNLYFTDNFAIADTDIPSGMVEIKTQALGLNFRDVMVALGQLDETLIGHECAGIITGLGPDTEESGLKVGDKVFGVVKGRFATNTRTFWTSVSKMPDDMSWEDAASIPLIFLTSYIALFDIARLEKGERVLIHAGTGGVGQSAIQLAQYVGAEVFATCSTEAKRDLLIEQYHLDSDHILSSRDTSFAQAINSMTDGKGVDVVVNSLSGPLLKATWDCMARFGRFVEVGKVDMEAARRLDMTPLGRSASITGFDLLQYSEYKGKAVHKALMEVVRLFKDKALRPIYPVTSYPISEMEAAMRLMQRGTHVGKLVLIPGPNDKVNIVTRSRSLSLEDPDSTYMIAGGLGGIGHAIALHMIEKGAKNILVTSRNAQSHPNAATLVKTAKAEGCNVHIRNCDISNEKSFVKLLADCVGTMPPIRGIIQAAMHLDDTVMELITYEQWQHSVMPKVAGSLNLHKHLPDAKFFVMLSSLAGVIGHASQSNYAAGNTFQDALARYRSAKGLPGVAIDLGAVGSVGFVAEAGDSTRELLQRNLSSIIVPVERVLLLIEAAMRDPIRKNIGESQVLVGLDEWDNMAEGLLVMKDKRFATLRIGSRSAGAGTAKRGASGARSADEVLKQALTNTPGPTAFEAVELVTGALTAKVANLFNIVAGEIDTDSSLSHLGVDSLVAVELRNWLSGVVQAKVSIFEILQSTTVKEFAGLVVKRSGLMTS